MMCQEFRLTRDPLGKAPLHDFGDARMQLLPIAAQKCAVGGILHQSVLEGVNGLRRRSALEHQFRSDEPGQFVLHILLVSAGNGTEQLVRKLAAGPSRSSRARSAPCSVAGRSSADLDAPASAPSALPPPARASKTAFVSSSTKSGTPSVRVTICSTVSTGRALLPATRCTSIAPSRRSSRLRASTVTCDRPLQGG